MSKKLSQKGFTLIELLLYVSITAVMLLTISVFLFSLSESRMKNQTIAEVEQQGSQVMQAITQTARNAEAITSPAPAANSSSLTLDVVAPANDPTVFDLSSGVVRIKEGTSAAVPLTNSHVSVTNLSFSNLSRSVTPGTIRVQFTIDGVNSSGRNEYSYTKNFAGSASLYWP